MRQRNAVAQLSFLHVDQFKRAATQIADDAIGFRDAGDHAKGGVARLLLAGEDIDANADGLFGAFE